MSNPKQVFRNDRVLLTMRIVVFTAAVMASWKLGPVERDWWIPAALLVATAAGTAVSWWALQARRHANEPVVYAPAVIDMAISGGALFAFGPLSPALAITLFAVSHHSVLLGPKMAPALALVAAAVITAAIFGHGEPFVETLATTGTLLVTTFVLAGYLGWDRARQRAARLESESSVTGEARASRVLTGVTRMFNVRGDQELAEALADAVRSASGYHATVVMFTRPSDGALVPVSWRMGHEPPAAGEAIEVYDADTPAACAARQGASLIYGPGGIDENGLPAWARERGFVSAVVTPLVSGMEAVGVVYALRADRHIVSMAELEQTELIASFGAKILSSASGPAAAGRSASLASIFDRRSRIDTPSKPPVTLSGISLDPDRDGFQISGADVALSRTEFALVYALARSPNVVVSQRQLIEAGWSGEAPGDTAVDVTMYRLRKKLAQVPGGKDLIQTVRGKGYMLVPPEASRPGNLAAAPV